MSNENARCCEAQQHRILFFCIRICIEPREISIFLNRLTIILYRRHPIRCGYVASSIGVSQGAIFDSVSLSMHQRWKLKLFEKREREKKRNTTKKNIRRWRRMEVTWSIFCFRPVEMLQHPREGNIICRKKTLRRKARFTRCGFRKTGASSCSVVFVRTNIFVLSFSSGTPLTPIGIICTQSTNSNP